MRQPRLLGLISRRSQKMDRWAAAVAGSLLVALAILIVALGPPPVTGPWDVFVLLDAGYRINSGQVPHLDYHNPVGPLPSLAIALGMKMVPSLVGITYSTLIVLAIFAPWAWFTARGRLSSVTSALLVLWVGLLIVTPRPLGYALDRTTYAMIYNRYGYALVSILFVGLFVKLRDEDGRPHILNDLSCGALVGFLLYCKVNFALVGAALSILGCIMASQPRRRAALLVIGASTVALFFWVAFRVPLTSYLMDVWDAASVQSRHMRFQRLVAGLRLNAVCLALTGVLLYLTKYFAPEGPEERTFWHETNRLRVVVVAGVVGAMFLVAGNNPEGTEGPMFFLLGLLLLDLFARRTPATSPAGGHARERASLAAAAIVIPIFFGNVFVRDAASTVGYLVWNATKRADIAPSQSFSSNGLRDFAIPESIEWKTAYWKARDTPQRINEGIDLLRVYSSGSSKVFSLALTNPFSFALGLPPTRGGPLWWDLDVSFNARVYPDADTIFADTDLVIFPKRSADADGCCLETVDVMKKIYSPYLLAHFVARDESAHWQLLARKEATSANVSPGVPH